MTTSQVIFRLIEIAIALYLAKKIAEWIQKWRLTKKGKPWKQKDHSMETRGNPLFSHRKLNQKGNNMKPFTPEQHREFLIRRRIKFVVEKGAMARLFKAGSSSGLQRALFSCLQPSEIVKINTRDEYDSWLIKVIESDVWEPFSKNGIGQDRWAYFAKLLNIIIYEITANRELLDEKDWLRLRPFLHVPLDWNVTYHLNQITDNIPALAVLKGMSKDKYLLIQKSIRELAEKNNIPPIWFEAAYSA